MSQHFNSWESDYKLRERVRDARERECSYPNHNFQREEDAREERQACERELRRREDEREEEQREEERQQKRVEMRRRFPLHEGQHFVFRHGPAVHPVMAQGIASA